MIERFPEAFLDDLRAAVPITDVVGQHVTWDKAKSNPGRRDMWAPCPFHNEATPSFHADAEKGTYHCFGCGASGDHFAFLEQIKSLSFPAAVAEVASMAGIQLPEGTGGGKAQKTPEHPRQTKTQPQPSAGQVRPEIVKTYDYTDRDGTLLYQVCRMQRKLPDGTWALNKDGKGTWKTFLQRRPDGAGRWIWSLSAGEFMRRPGGDWRAYDAQKFAEGMETRFFDAGAEHTIYRHPEVEIAIESGLPILCVEGEKDADTAAALGFCGTTNSSGSKHWTATHAANFRDADVVICLDNDAAGDRADKLAQSMKGIARRIRVLDFAKVVPNFPAKGDITDWVEQFGGTADQLQALIDALPDYRPKPPASKFGAKSFADLAGAPIVYDWLIKGLVERNGVFIFAGEKQAGKSFAIMDMGMKIARGIQYGDRITRRGLVIHIACEDGKGVQMRAEGYRMANGIGANEVVPYMVMDRNFTLMDDERVDALIAEAKAWADYFDLPLELIIIDTLSVATEGLNEIDGAEVGKVLARVNRLKDQTGAAVCLVHHMNASGGRVRGHTSIEANVSQVFEIRPLMTMPQNRKETPQPVLDGSGRHIRQIVLTKNKNGINNLKWRIVLDVVQLGIDADGDPITTCVCISPTKAQRQEQEEREKLSPDQRLVFEALVTVQDDAGQEMPPGTSAPPQIKRCVPQPEFMAAVRRKMTFTAAEEEVEQRNRELSSFLKRTTTSLINAGYMGRDNDLKIVWWTGKSDKPKRAAREGPEPPVNSGVPDHVIQEINVMEAPF